MRYFFVQYCLGTFKTGSGKVWAKLKKFENFQKKIIKITTQNCKKSHCGTLKGHMHLRSGKHLGFQGGFDTASRVPTQSSGVSVTGNLETIAEDVFSDTTSSESWNLSTDMSTEPERSMGQGYSQDMHDQPLSQPNSPITNEHRPFRNPVNQRTLEMEFNMRLKYEGINAYGAQIFRDPLSRYYVKTSEFVTPLQQAPWVEYQEEQCIGEDGARYVLTAEPENVDTIGQPVKLRPAPDNQESFQQREDEPTTSQNPQPGLGFSFPASEMFNNPNTFSFFSDNDKGKGKEDEKELKWVVYDRTDVSRVPQDDIIRLVYRTASGTYYSTINERGVDLQARQILFLERLQDFSAYRMVDLYGNMYATLDWEEVRTLTWRGKSGSSKSKPSSNC